MSRRVFAFPDTLTVAHCRRRPFLGQLFAHVGIWFEKFLGPVSCLPPVLDWRNFFDVDIAFVLDRVFRPVRARFGNKAVQPPQV